MDTQKLSGLALATLAFGVFFFDYDLDGYPDIFAANGHIEDEIGRVQPKVSYKEAPLLFRNLGNHKFENVSGAMGAAWHVSYAAAQISVVISNAQRVHRMRFPSLLLLVRRRARFQWSQAQRPPAVGVEGVDPRVDLGQVTLLRRRVFQLRRKCRESLLGSLEA